MQISHHLRLRNVLAIVVATALVAATACTSGCSGHQDKAPDMSKAFQKTAPPTAYTAWQKGQFASGGTPKP